MPIFFWLLSSLLCLSSLTVSMEDSKEHTNLLLRIAQHDPSVLSILEDSNTRLDEVFPVNTESSINLLECALFSNNIAALEVLYKRDACLREESIRLLFKHENWFSFYEALQWLVYKKILNLKRHGAWLIKEAQNQNHRSAISCLFRLGVAHGTLLEEADWVFFTQMFLMHGDGQPFYNFMNHLFSEEPLERRKYKEREKGSEDEYCAQHTVLTELFLLASAHGAQDAVSLILLHRWNELPEKVIQEALNMATLGDHAAVFRSIMHHLELRNSLEEILPRIFKEPLAIAARYRSYAVLELLVNGYDVLKPQFSTVARNFIQSLMRENQSNIRHVIKNNSVCSSAACLLLICILVCCNTLFYHV